MTGSVWVRLLVLLLFVPAAGAAITPERTAVVAAFDLHVKPLFATYCLDCHGVKKVKGDTNLRFLTDGEIALRDQPLVRHALGKLLRREMPPPDERQPTEEERRQRRSDQQHGDQRPMVAPSDPMRVTLMRLSGALDGVDRHTTHSSHALLFLR